MGVDAARRQTIWIARHGNRMDFVDSGWRGRAERPEDTPLSPDGIIQAKELGKRLAGEGITRIISSPFHRAVETSHHVAEALDLPIYIENGVCECLKSEWFPFTPRLRTPEEHKAEFPRVDLSYQSLPMPDYPETEHDLQARLTRMGAYLADKFAGEDILIVAHGGSTCCLTNGFMGTEDEEISTPLCCLTKIVRGEAGYELIFFADASHLTSTDDGTRMN
jgi:broad specificity phosphatase PhoE